MKNLSRIMTAIAGGVLVMSASSPLAQDWPQWRGQNRDGKVTGFITPKTWPKDLTRQWQVRVGSGDATPALVGDNLYVFSRQETDEIARCLDAGTGKELWQNKYATEAVVGPDIAHGGPRSSPAVADGKVVTLGVCGMLSCLEAATGKVLWRKDDFPGAWPQFHTAMSPLLVEGLCIVHLGNESNGAMVAYDLGTGNQKWQWSGEGPGYASPVLLTVGHTKMIITQTPKSIVALGLADGKLLWRDALAARGLPYSAVTPIVDGHRVIYSDKNRGTKAVELMQDGNEFIARTLWNNAGNPVAFNSPVLKNDLLFGLSQRGNFFCIDARSGRTMWVEPDGGRGDFGAIVDAGPVLLGLTATSQVTVFLPSDKQFTELASFKVAESQTYAHPVVAGKRLFIKDQNSVTLWTIE